MGVVPFYGGERPDLFAIEQRAVDRPGRLIAALDDRLPDRGVIADAGAGDGFTAEHLTTEKRTVVGIEPARSMIRPERPIPWVMAEAEALPFAAAPLDGAYPTWAYFFTRDWDPVPASPS